MLSFQNDLASAKKGWWQLWVERDKGTGAFETCQAWVQGLLRKVLLFTQVLPMLGELAQSLAGRTPKRTSLSAHVCNADKQCD